MTRLRIGVIDSSISNGHMFSFSSFFNGYEVSELEKCPFPAIISYLPNHVTPVEALSTKAVISAVWMDDLEYAKSVARFAKIATVYTDLDDLIKNVDGIIHTNDEPVGREAVLNKCLASGKMVFVDKMIARTSEKLEKQLLHQRYPGQLYCASAISFSSAVKEISWDTNTEYVVFAAPKNWANYGIHIVDAFLIFASLNNLEYEIGKITHDGSATERQINILNPGDGKILLRTEGRADVNFSIKASKNGIEQEVTISDPFDAFAAMLNTWLSRDPAKTHLSEYKRYDDAVAILGCNRE